MIMWPEKWQATIALLAAFVLSLLLSVIISADGEYRSWLPALFGSKEYKEYSEEVRGLWVTRFDWSGTDPTSIDQIVSDAAAAGFNVLYFQVRGEGDAFYRSSLVPWSRRLNTERILGQDPGWDPLERLVSAGHAAGLQVHAYLNVYPIWTGCTPPPDDVNPTHIYYLLEAQQGQTEGKLNAAQWDINGNIICEPYLRASPASIPFDDHLRAVVKELAQKYDVDGIHLDHIRYAGSASSCDPVSEERYGAPCDDTTEYADWQRQQIDGTVEKLYTDLSALDREIWLSAAVWPVYQDNFGWGVKGGFDSYYQDSKAWLAGQYIDSISPMIYTGSPNCSGPYFWTRERWSALVADFQKDNAGRYVIPGIGVDFCTDDDFAEITARIEEARRLGTAGHAIFSYSGLKDRGFFEKLANGPYAQPASVPPLPWH